MIDKDSAYVTDVKILDVEKRYRPGPKHYVCIIKKEDRQIISF
jgi:hypothetical protein